MAIATLPAPAATSGISTIQDLYDLINGKTTTDSGGTTSSTVTGGLDQAGMNAMFKSAMESTNGLAAVSQGQRTAGGYGSSVNTMLTNDLMARTAGQIAAANINKTTTTTTPQTTKTVGGVTASGAINSAGFLGALQALNQTGASSWLKKNVFGDKVAPADATSNGIIGAGAAANPMNMDPQQSQAQAAGIDASQFINAQVDNSGSPTSIVDFVGAPNVQESGNVSIPDFVAPTAPDPVFTAPTGTDLIDEYADGGYITKNGGPGPYISNGHPMVMMADGGPVTKKPSVLGTSQFNSVVDPRQGLAGESITLNPDGTVNTGASGSGGTTAASSGSGSGGGSSSSRTIGDNIGNAVSGNMSQSDAQGLSAGLSVVGRLMQNPTLANLGTIGQIASSANPGMAAAETGANVATGGLYGKVKSAIGVISNPSVVTGVNALSSLNPVTAIANQLASLAGLPSIGSVVGTTIANGMEGDPMDNMMSLTNAYGTAVSENPSVAPAPSNAADPNSPGPASIGDTSGPIGTVTSGYSSGGHGGNGGVVGDRGPGGSSGEAGAAAAGASPSGPGLANGGEVDGAGTGVSDSIHAMLSDGEFVLSKDVVDAIGVHNLQALQDKYHTPAAVQKLKSFARA
jgi:hypothetical protein